MYSHRIGAADVDHITRRGAKHRLPCGRRILPLKIERVQFVAMMVWIGVVAVFDDHEPAWISKGQPNTLEPCSADGVPDTPDSRGAQPLSASATRSSAEHRATVNCRRSLFTHIASLLSPHVSRLLAHRHTMLYGVARIESVDDGQGDRIVPGLE